MNIRSHITWLLVVTCISIAPAHSQQTSKPAAKAAAFSVRDLSGIWAKPSGGRGRGRTEELQAKGETAEKTDRPESAWTDQKLPFTPEGRAAFDANKPTGGPRQVKSQVSGNDPRDAGNPLGLYRAIQYSGNGRSFEIGNLNGNIVQLLSIGRIWRTIYTDGRPVPKEVATGPFWYGHSVGHWEGDTLVIVTQALDERQWLDPWGTPISVEARIEERWRRIAPDELQLTFTVNDPLYYTKPWSTIPEAFTRQRKGIEPEEIIYAPIDIQGYNQETLLPSSNNATK